MDWQQAPVFLVVAAAAAYLLARAFRTRRPWERRGGSCCAGHGSAPRPDAIVTLHGRKGERPEFRVRPR